MKLYATITSDRATKGQGGNKEIRIQLQAGANAREKTYEIIYKMSENDVILEVKYPFDNDYLLRLIDKYPDVNTKAKRQKGEMGLCNTCNIPTPYYAIVKRKRIYYCDNCER